MSSPSARAAGRPRQFDLGDALDRAIAVFSERGYHATSIADLKAAMGLTAGSIYKAFPDKKAIFLAAFDRYKAQRDAALAEKVEAGNSGRDRIRRMLDHYAEMACGDSGRRGCLVVGAAVELSLFDTDVADRVQRSRSRQEALLRDLVISGKADGSIPVAVDPDATAGALYCFIQGLRIAGKSGQQPSAAAHTVLVAMKLLD
ncbi:TetR/AcrR family transcriptional regulator [Rhizobium halophytocola]|uniref:AcrR family transcriptional regulator n=1 Tax=Rhizobium halophytocola TaxID=735519 RepID=A0ABS4E1I2_9HYPH|nr:TetR/AcrR family transcriptional regulator [Rhizobium halophytocola]MBP1851795.1 AcrR family transcriptional regulator [Rhizobium halophytocola]